MTVNNVKKYLCNCFLLTLPILIWNVAFAGKLPHDFQQVIFWKDIPAFIMYGENISRTAVFMLTLLMPISISTTRQKKGLLLYTGGTMIYFTSWLALIYFPDTGWTSSVLGFMAPACTPILWLTGIGLIGNSFYFKIPFKNWYFFITSTVFLVFHNFHTVTIFLRTR